jgi:hypothetical protein
MEVNEALALGLPTDFHFHKKGNPLGGGDPRPHVLQRDVEIPVPSTYSTSDRVGDFFMDERFIRYCVLKFINVKTIGEKETRDRQQSASALVRLGSYRKSITSSRDRTRTALDSQSSTTGRMCFVRTCCHRHLLAPRHKSNMGRSRIGVGTVLLQQLLLPLLLVPTNR